MAENLVLGRGKMYFAPYPKGSTTGGVKGYFGNTPLLTLAQTNTKLDHFSSEAGLKIKDRSIILQTDMTVTFDCDDIQLGNLALWFGGNATDALPSDAPADLGSIGVIGKGDMIYGALFFESDNPIGANSNYWWPYVSLTPNGNLALKGDAWQTVSFTADCLKRDASTERVYVFEPSGGISTASTDTTPQLNVGNVEVGEDFYASSATITAGMSQVHGTAFAVGVTLNAGTAGDDLMSYLFINNGTSVLAATRMGAVGAVGTIDMTAPAAGTVSIEAFGNSVGTGTPIGTLASIVVT